MYFIINFKNLGKDDSQYTIPESELEKIQTLSKKIPNSTLIIFWQFILRGLEEMNIVSNQILSLEMIVIRLIHLKALPNYEEVLNLISKQDTEDDESRVSPGQNPLNVNIKVSKKNLDTDYKDKNLSTEQIKNIEQTKPSMLVKQQDNLENSNFVNFNNFEELIKYSSQKREIELKYDLEKNVNLVSFSNGKIDISFNDNLSKNFIRNLSEKLFKWTGKRWVISLTKEKGQKTFEEISLDKKKLIFDQEKKSELYNDLAKNFPDIELIEVEKIK